MTPTLSICIPCYNKASHIEALIEALEPLREVAELCIFDNGSTDGLQEIIRDKTTSISIRYQRSEIRGPIDHSWLTALSLGAGDYLKLQLGDDIPHAANILLGLANLIDHPEKDFIISPCKVEHSSEILAVADEQKAYFDQANVLRRRVGDLESEFDRANFIFSEFAFGNSLGDINGVIFKKTALQGFSPISQIYYGCVTHPDAEILLYLIANRSGLSYDFPFSTYYSASDSPVNKAKDRNFQQKVYRLPAFIHTLLLYVDPGFSSVRHKAKRAIYYKVLLRLMWRLLKEAIASRRVTSDGEIR